MPAEEANLEILRPRSGRRRPSPAPTIIFDADDTLWVTQWLYDQAEQETRLIVEAAGLDGNRWDEIFQEHDRKNVARFGFGPGRIPTSVVAAYTQLCEESGTTVRIDILGELIRSASSMFRRKAPLVGGVQDVLEALRPDYQLVLLTKGDPRLQRKRIKESGLARYFDAIVIVPDKNPDVFSKVCTEFGADLSRSWSVGNSLPSDIAPAMRAGLRGVLVEANSWNYEKRDSGIIPGKFEKLERLRDLPQLLARIAKGPMFRHEGLAS